MRRVTALGLSRETVRMQTDAANQVCDLMHDHRYLISSATSLDNFHGVSPSDAGATIGKQRRRANFVLAPFPSEKLPPACKKSHMDIEMSIKTSGVVMVLSSLRNCRSISGLCR